MDVRFGLIKIRTAHIATSVKLLCIAPSKEVGFNASYWIKLYQSWKGLTFNGSMVRHIFSMT